jgi:hypothetical protein
VIVAPRVFFLTLPLFVSEVVADHHNATITTNDFALVANLLHAWFDLHVLLLTCTGK